MLHDIHPHLFDNHFEVVDGVLPSDFILHFENGQLLLRQDGDRYELPTAAELTLTDVSPFYLFAFNGINCFWAPQIGNHLSRDFSYFDMGFLRTQVTPEIAWVGAVGKQLKEWYEHNRFCGRCGSATHHKGDERALVCGGCGHLIFPRISPAIIVAVTCGDHILLAHNVNFPNNLYSLIAGYADVGDPLEETVRREVCEEVGIEVSDIRYYKSQPWPFSGSLMIGFTAKADGCLPLKPDGGEIADAQWFHRRNLPYRPNSGSIAGEMLTRFENGEL